MSHVVYYFFFFKQKTAYEMRISDWSSDVCSSDLARRKPGMLVGVFLIGYGLARFTVEFFREPDAQLVAFAARTGLHMGQWLTLPMFIGGFYLITTAGRRAPPPEKPALATFDRTSVFQGKRLMDLVDIGGRRN